MWYFSLFGKNFGGFFSLGGISVKKREKFLNKWGFFSFGGGGETQKGFFCKKKFFFLFFQKKIGKGFKKNPPGPLYFPLFVLKKKKMSIFFFFLFFFPFFQGGFITPLKFT